MSCVTSPRSACAVQHTPAPYTSHTQWLLGDCSLFSLELGHSFSGLCLHDQLASVISPFPSLVSRKPLCCAKKQSVRRGSAQEQVAPGCMSARGQSAQQSPLLPDMSS